jgi:hypothetical protein
MMVLGINRITGLVLETPGRPTERAAYTRGAFSATLFSILVSPHFNDAHSMCSDTGVHAARFCIQLVGRCPLRARDSRSRAAIQGGTSNTGREYPRLAESATTRGGVYEKMQEEVKDVEGIVPSTADEPLSSELLTHVQPSSLFHANEPWLRQLEIAATPRTSLSEMVPEQ